VGTRPGEDAGEQRAGGRQFCRGCGPAEGRERVVEDEVGLDGHGDAWRRKNIGLERNSEEWSAYLLLLVTRSWWGLKGRWKARGGSGGESEKGVGGSESGGVGEIESKGVVERSV